MTREEAKRIRRKFRLWKYPPELWSLFPPFMQKSILDRKKRVILLKKFVKGRQIDEILNCYNFRKCSKPQEWKKYIRKDIAIHIQREFDILRWHIDFH